MSEENNNAVIADGFYDAVIRDAYIIENHFNPQQGYEVKIEVGVFDSEKRPLTTADTYLELSNRPGLGNNANKTSYAITIEKLEKLGFKGGEDLSRIAEIKGLPCRMQYATADKNGVPLKYGPRWTLTFSRPEKRVDPVQAMAALKQMMSIGAAVPPPPPAGSPFNMATPAAGMPAPAGDPFANL